MKLLRSAPDPPLAKEYSFEIAIEHVSRDHGQQMQVWREPIPGRRASNRESVPLSDRSSRIGLGTRSSRAKRTAGLGILGGATKLSEVGRGQTQEAAPDQGQDPVRL